LAKQAKEGLHPDQVVAEAAKGRVRPIYLLYGTEYYYRRAIISALRQELFKDAEPGMCLSEYDGKSKELAVGRVLDDVRTLTFFGGMRLVIVENADGFVSENKDVLGRYAKAPSKTGCLVLLCDEVPDQRWVLAKEIDAHGAQVACVTPKYGPLLAWMKTRARELGKNLAHPAAQALSDIVGPDLAQLDSHIQMLVTYVGSRKSIEEQDVLAAVDQEKVTEIWDLLDGVASKNARKALEAFDRLLPKAGMESARLASISGTLLKLRTVKKMMDTIRDEQKVIQRLKMHPYAAKKSIEQSRRFSWQDLDRGLRGALEADIAIKSSRMEPRLAVETFIVELCRTNES